MRPIGEDLSGHPVSTRLKMAALSPRSEDLIRYEVEIEEKESTVQQLTQQPSSFDHDLPVPREPLISTALLELKEIEKLDPLVPGSTHFDAPQISPNSNHSKARRIAGRRSLVTPWECLAPPKSAAKDMRPLSPPCHVKGILQRAKRKVFSLNSTRGFVKSMTTSLRHQTQ